MPISEAQLSVWSHQGSKIQSAATYASIRQVLLDPAAPYANRDFEIYLQGSYGNDTNIFADSDVDIIICLTSTYYEDLEELSVTDRQRHDANWSAATYQCAEFKVDVAQWLTAKFGTGVEATGKAIFIPGNGNRRNTDILVCAEYRDYWAYSRDYSNEYRTGICFWDKSGQRIVNFPKDHATNCTQKHQNTGGNFKPTVRIFKNMRNSLLQEGLIADGLAPSYFVEGMLWNVPNDQYHGSHQSIVAGTVNWLRGCDTEPLKCANDFHWLLREGHSVCWRKASFDSFLSAVETRWNAS